MVAGVGWASSQRLRVWWKRSTLPQVVGWFGREFFWMMPRLSRRCSKPLRPPLPPDSRVVNTIPLSVSVEAGMPWSSRALVNASTTMRAGDTAVGGDRDGVAGVVVEPAEDLDVAAVGEAVVGEVGLPRLVRQVGLEADVGRARAFRRLDLGQTVAAQGAVDRRSRHGQVVMGGEVPGDRVGAGIDAFGDELVAELHDQLDGRRRGGPWARVWSPRPRLKRRVALDPVAGDELVDPRASNV